MAENTNIAQPHAVFFYRPCGSCVQTTLGVGFPHVRVDTSACGGCRGASRSALSTGTLSSYLLQTRRLLCCAGARLTLRAGARHSAATPLAYADGAAAVDALEAALVPVAGISSLPLSGFTTGGACNMHSLVDCTVRETRWSFLSTGWVRVERIEEGFCGDCAKNTSVEGAPFDHVVTTTAFSNVGSCACTQTPSGRCSTQDYVSLGLDDGASIYGSATKGNAKLLLDDLALRASGASEQIMYVAHASEDCCDCLGAAMELVVTHDRVTIVRHNQPPCVRVSTCSCCLGVYKESIRVKDVVGVTASQRATCEVPNAIVLRLGRQARKLVDALQIDPLLLFLLFVLAFLAIAWAIEFDVAGAVASATGVAVPTNFLGVQRAEYPLVVCAVLIVLWTFLKNGVDVLVPVGVLLFSANDLVLLVLSIFAVPLELCPCCEHARVRVLGAHGDTAFSIRPVLDLKMDTQAAALHIAHIVESLRQGAAVGGEKEGAPLPGAAVVAWGETPERPAPSPSAPPPEVVVVPNPLAF